MPPVERFVALFDILGFSPIVEQHDLERVVSAFRFFEGQAQLSTRVPAVWGETPSVEYRVFSDTVLAFTPDVCSSSIRNLLLFSSCLLYSAFNTGLAIRGAVTRGQTFIDDPIFIGEPIVRAYGMERSQEWAGCWVADDCVAPEHLPAVCNLIRRYPIPLKDRAVEGWAVRWGDRLVPRVSATPQDIENAFFVATARTPDTYAKIAAKIRNTQAFIQSEWLHLGKP